MIYLIGGVPRSGKTQIQKYILNKYRISGISLDMLRGGLYKIPELCLSDEVNDLEKSVKMWDFIKGLVQTNEYYNDDLVIEGVNFLPEFLSQLKDKDYVRMCFVGYDSIEIHQKVEQIKSYRLPSDWTHELDDKSLIQLITRHHNRSKEIKNECELYNIKYFDTSAEFEEVIKKAGEFLMDRSKTPS